eukprot:4688768-Pyramimonas_sp.AAC.1
MLATKLVLFGHPRLGRDPIIVMSEIFPANVRINVVYPGRLHLHHLIIDPYLMTMQQFSIPTLFFPSNGTLAVFNVQVRPGPCFVPFWFSPSGQND